MKSKNSELLPLISIVVPAYNASQFIEFTLHSISQQTYKNIEIIVVNDGSKDRTADIVRSFAQSDSRITLINQPNSGVSVARNSGINKSRGKFIAFIDADDIYYPQAIEKMTNAMLQAKDSVGVVYAWSAHIDREGNLTGGFNSSLEEEDVYEAFLSKNFIGNASATLVCRDSINKVGNFDRQIPSGSADKDFYLRLAENYQFKVVPEFLIGYRKLANSMSCDFSLMEKGFVEVMKNARQRNPQISTKFIRTSQSWYFLYLNSQSRNSFKYYESFKYLYKAIMLNPKFCFDFQFYRFLSITLVEIIIFPLSFLLRRNNISLTRLKQKFRKNYYQVDDISDLYNLAYKSLPNRNILI